MCGSEHFCVFTTPKIPKEPLQSGSNCSIVYIKVMKVRSIAFRYSVIQKRYYNLQGSFEITIFSSLMRLQSYSKYCMVLTIRKVSQFLRYEGVAEGNVSYPRDFSILH